MINSTFSYADLEYFLLIFTRVTCFIFIAPFFGMNNTPRRVKIGLGIFVSLLIFNGITPHEVIEYGTLMEYSIIVMKEAVTGFLVGFGATLSSPMDWVLHGYTDGSHNKGRRKYFRRFLPVYGYADVDYQRDA